MLQNTKQLALSNLAIHWMSMGKLDKGGGRIDN